MRIIRAFSLGVLLALGIFALIALMLPSKYELEQSVLIAAPATEVFDQINELRNWDHWAFVNTENDQRLAVNYTGPSKGVGCRMTWQLEDGSVSHLEVVKAMPPISVEVRLVTNDGAFVSDGAFTIEEGAGQTLVKWKETGDFGFNLFARFIASVGGFKEEMSKNYQQALSVLKQYCEKQ
ncbi:SRPBCC family protein [Limibacter armeniacum]|uniref:SRPBCC family protein n=1 Tax=Limibacter armeniacum TaxID=466084 RepID=UPI002FE5E68C